MFFAKLLLLIYCAGSTRLNYFLALLFFGEKNFFWLEPQKHA